MAKKILLTLLIISVLSLGFLRDFLFLNINYRLGYLWKNNETYYTATSAHLLKGFSYYELYYGKYLLTLGFSIIYMMLCIGLFSLLFEQNHSKKIIFIYTSITLLCALVFGLGLSLNDAETYYSFARYVMGFVQSPVLIGLLYFGVKASE